MMDQAITPRYEFPRNYFAPTMTLAPDMTRVIALTANDTVEVQEFLAVRPVHTIIMSSFIVDNGLVSELNRGVFYGYRGAAGQLEGVALLGHTTLFETRTEEAVIAFAITARTSKTPLHVIMSAGDAADKFWKHFNQSGQGPRLRCEELLFEASFPFLVKKCDWNIQKADESQLIQIAEAQAEVAFMESGVDPMIRDREGFLKRVTRRIEKGRIYSVFENGKLIFKADVMAQTQDVIYLEGVWVSPEHRGKGLGPACLSALTVELLAEASNVCLLSNVNFDRAHRGLEKACYRATDTCVTLFT